MEMAAVGLGVFQSVDGGGDGCGDVLWLELCLADSIYQ